MRLALLLPVFIFHSFAAMAQPVNDGCDGAVDLGLAPACADRIFSNLGAGNSGAGPAPTCFNGRATQRDVWFAFNTGENLTEVSIFLGGRADGPNAQPLRNPQIALYRGNCTGLSELACASAPPGANDTRLDARNLLPNTTYFLRVNDYSATAAPNWGDFSLCVQEFAPTLNLGEAAGSTACFGTLFDSGGPNRNYGVNERHVFTICPSQPSACIEIDLKKFEIEGPTTFFNGDRLNFYAGDNTSAPLIASIYGVSDGSPFVLQSKSECVTVEFISDFFVQLAGFELQWRCSATPCDGSFVDAPSPIPSLPFTARGLSTCQGKATVSGTPCRNDQFINGPEYIFAYDASASQCLSLRLLDAAPGLGLAVLDRPPGSPDGTCVALSVGGFIPNAELEAPGRYYIVVAGSRGCSGFGLRVEETPCPLSPSLVNALRNPLNGCVNPDGLPSIFLFREGFQDIDIIEGVNGGCWINVGSQADFYWFSIQARQQGFLGFILSSADAPSDLDFNVWGPFQQQQVVYAPDDVVDYIRGNQPIRSSWSPGRKPTGLVRVHPVTGRLVTEAYDCGDTPGAAGDDFVSAILAQPGEVYVVLVNDWSNEIQNGGIKVDWSPTSLNLLEPVDPEIIRGDTAICRGDSAQILLEIGTNTIQWIAGAETLSCDDCPNPVARPTRTTTYRAVVSSVCFIDTLDITVEVFDLSAGPDQTVCAGEIVGLVAGGDFDNATYAWSVTPATGARLSCVDCPNPLVNAEQAGTYTISVRLSAQGGRCVLEDAMTLTVLPQPAPVYEINRRRVEICQGESTTIGIDRFEGNLNFNWTSNPPGFSSNQPTFAVSPAQTTTYYVSISGGQCPEPSRDSVVVVVFRPPNLQIANDTILCRRDTIQLGRGSREQDVAYTWTGPPDILDVNDYRTQAVALESGTYTLTATRGACTVQRSFTTNVNPADVEILQGDTASHCLGSQSSFVALVRQPPGQNLTPQWSSSDPNFSPTAAISINVSPTDTTIYRVQVSYLNCVQTDSILVLVDSLPSELRIMPLDTSICEGEYVIFRTPAYETSLYPNITFEWRPFEGQQTPDSLLNMVVAPDTTTIYSRATINGACVDTNFARVEVKPIADLFVVPSDTTVCVGETVRYTLVKPGDISDISWSPPNGLSCTDCENPLAAAAATVTYEVSAEFDGCPISASTNLNVVGPPRFQLTNRTAICPGEEVQLNSVFDPNAEYVWTSTDPNFGIVREPRPVVSPTLPSTTYFLSADNGLCDPVTTEVTIVVIQQVNLQVSAVPTSICAGEAVTLSATAVGGSANDQFFWNTSDGRSFSGPQITDRPGASVTYFLTYVDGANCQTLNRSVNVNVTPGISVRISTTSPPEVPEGSEVVLFAEVDNQATGPVNIVWTEDGAAIPGAAGLEVTVRPPRDGVEYVVTVTNAGGCTASDTISFDVIEPEFQIPNIFTPNGDGKNDRFTILKTGAIERIIRFQVYNRWGQLVYNNDQGEMGWDGNFRGKPQPSDVYVYIITVRTLGGVERTFQGDVTLLR